MYNSKLITILTKLTTVEKEAFRKWVHSPMHNQRSDRTKLFNYLLSKRKLTPRTTDRYQVYRVVFDCTDYHDTTFKKLMNLSVQLLEDFIHFSSQKKDIQTKQKSLISFAAAHQLDQYKQQSIAKAQKKLKLLTVQNHSYFEQKTQLEKLIFESNETATDRSQTNLQDVVDQQYIAFILETLRFACEAITHQRLYKSSYNIPLLEAILQDIANGKYMDTPAIQLYYYSYLALSNPTEETHFKTLKKLLKKYPAIISPKELKSIYLIAINYCVQQLNNGAETYVKEVFELYQYGLEQTILIENNLLSRFTYKNIVAVAIRLEQYTWLKDFLQAYTPYLETTYRPHYAAYAQAKLSFAQHDFDKALQILTKVEFDNIFLNMDAKVMLLKIYYANEDFDALDALLTSFRRFLQRKSILAYQRQIHENMINLTTKLLHIPSRATQKQLALRQEIEQTNPLTEKPWLLQQLDCLGRR